MDNEIKIRLVKPEDALELQRIYKQYVKHTAITFECNVPTVSEFKERIINTLKKYPYLKAVYNDKIVGYTYVGPLITRAACNWSVETSIYVDENYKKLGIGSKLYDSLEKILIKQNITNLYACISYPKIEDEYLTKNSVSYHEKQGYKFVGEFHNCAYKFNKWYNMIWMEKIIGNHSENISNIKNFNDIKNEIKDEYGIY
ncbi:MAG: GNAT family N-acetyltransferase [Methanobrevibacter wolinii]|nr:GNAT family N-acetyltransferase [Methanobrevibacter wolinii]